MKKRTDRRIWGSIFAVLLAALCLAAPADAALIRDPAYLKRIEEIQGKTLTELNAEQQTLVDAVPEQMRALTYALLGGDGIAYLRLAQGYYAEDIEFYYTMDADAIREQLLGILNQLQYGEDENEVQLALRMYALAMKQYCVLEKTGESWTIRSYEQAQGYETSISELSPYDLRDEIAKNTSDADYKLVQEAWLTYLSENDRRAKIEELRTLPYLAPSAGQRDLMDAAVKAVGARTSREAIEIATYAIATGTDGFAYLREKLGYTPEALAPFYALGDRFESELRAAYESGAYNETMLLHISAAYLKNYGVILKDGTTVAGYDYDFPNIGLTEHPKAETSQNGLQELIDAWEYYNTGYRNIDNLAAELSTMALPPLNEQQLSLLNAVSDIFKPVLYGYLASGAMDSAAAAQQFDDYDTAKLYGWAYLVQVMGYDAERVARFTEYEFNYFSDLFAMINARNGGALSSEEILLQASACVREGTVLQFVQLPGTEGYQLKYRYGIKKTDQPIIKLSANECLQFVSQSKRENNQIQQNQRYQTNKRNNTVTTPAELIDMVSVYITYLEKRDHTDSEYGRKAESTAAAEVPAPTISGSYTPKLLNVPSLRTAGRASALLRSTSEVYWSVLYKVYVDENAGIDAFYRSALTGSMRDFFEQEYAKPERELRTDYMRLYAKREQQSGYLTNAETNQLELLRSLLIWLQYEKYGRVVAVRCDSARNLLMYENKYDAVLAASPEELLALINSAQTAENDVYGQEYLAMLKALRTFKASDPRRREDGGNWFNLPSAMSDTVLNIVRHTNDYQRVYAYLCADGTLMEQYDSSIWDFRYWTWMPQQLVKQKEMSDNLKGMPDFATRNMRQSMLSDEEERMIADILALYGAAPYFNAKEPTFFSDYSGIYSVTFGWGSHSSSELYRCWDLSMGADICLEAGAVYCQALLNPNGGGTNGVPHFVSSRGEYHYPLAHRTADELYDYYEEMEQKYKDATDPGDEQELKEWLELINAWIALRRADSLESTGEEVAVEGEIAYTGLSDAKAHTYLLEISTGAASGAKVEYLKVLYTTADGAQRTAYIFPQSNSLRASYQTAAAVGTGRATARWIESNLGYQAGDGMDRKGLQSFKTDQYLLSLYGEIASIDEVQAFARKDKAGASGNNWTLYGVNLYAVDGVRGIERYGYYSSDVYIDFDGTLAARVAFDGDVTYPGEGAGGSDRVVLGNYHNLNWTGSDTLFRFGGAFTTFGYELQTAGFGSGGTRSGMQADSNVIIKLDFADKYLAGLECLSTGYVGDKTLGGAGNICEALALQVRYIDTAGGTRQATLPVTTSVAAWLVNSRTLDLKQNYAGVAQQGESIAFPCALPDFSEMVSITVINGATSAAEAAGLTATKDFRGAAERDRRIEQSDGDRVAITGIAIYKAAEGALSADTQNGFPRFSVDASPVQYYVSANDEGTGVTPGGSVTLISDAYADHSRGAEQAGQYLRSYAQGSRLKPVNREERYLVTLYTDDIEHAGTTSDVVLRLKYTDLDGVEQETPLFSARDYANEYYGYWPASKSDFGYLSGMSVTPLGESGWRGGELNFIVPIQNVQTFTGASLRLTGEDARGHAGDEWQMKDLAIRTVEDVGTRELRWADVSNSGGTSDRSFTRAVAGREIFRLSTMGASGGYGTTSDPNDPNGGVIGSSGGSGGSGGGNYTGAMLFQNSDYFTWDINVPSEVERSSVDWNRLKYNMSYAEAVQDLAFRRTRGTYTVDVNVASDANNYGGDDCGSKNQFYFQLVFEDGCSGVVLANQALESDGFRAGTTERFTITTTKDFGELQFIRIIPEDLSSDSDKYDKLKIDSINVRRATTGQTSPLWKFTDIGWIGIDYRDEGAAETLGGAAKRTMEEIAHTYAVSESTVSVNVQVSITTAPYTAEDGSTLPQFRGELSAVLRYRDTGGVTRKVQLDDVVRLMYEFNNQTPRYAETVSRMDGATSIGNAVSDPAYMFRANRTDRFEVGLDGLERILSITFQPTAESGVQTKWNVSDVSVYLIHGQGRRMLNAQGEYYMSYQDDEQLEMVAWDTSSTNPKHTADLFVTGSKTKGFEVEFGASKITLDNETTRASQLSELPLSDNDTLNVVLFPDEQNNDWASELYDMKLIAQYSMAGRDALMQASVRQMNHAVLEDGTKAFVWEGLNVNGINALYSLSAKADRDGSCAISGGYAQLVRGGFVYQTYSLGNVGNLDLGMDIPMAVYTGERQEVRIQLGADMTEQRLTTGKNDVAVSFTYRAEGPGSREYQSPRILLSKQGFNALKPGEIIDLTFAQGRVREITGMTIQTVGTVSLAVDGAFASDIVTNAKGETVNGRWSFLPGAGERGSLIGMYRAEDDAGRGRVDVLTLQFTTAAGQENKGGGMNAAVAMTIGYYDGYGAMQTRTIADIRPYIQNGGAFPANATTTVQLLMSDVADLRYVELTPAQEETGTTAWNLTRITAKFGDDGHELERTVTPPLEANITYHYNLASILVGASVERSVTQAGESGELRTVTVTEETKDGALSVLIASGERIRVTPKLTGSTDNVRVTLYGLNSLTGAMGAAKLDDTRGYTKEYIAERVANAPSEEEAAVWLSVTPQTGSFEESTGGAYVFAPPRNYTGSAVSYRIIITSVESEDVSAYVDVTVESEAEDPVVKQITEVRARKELEAQLEIQRKQRELEERLNNMGSDGSSSSNLPSAEKP